MYPIPFGSFREDLGSHLATVKVNVSFVVDSGKTKRISLYTFVIFDVGEVGNQSSWKHAGVLHRSAALLNEAILGLNTVILDRH